MISRKRTLSLRSRRTCFPYALEHKSSLAGEGGQPNQRVFVLNLERAMGIELYPQSTSLCDLTALPPPSASSGAKFVFSLGSAPWRLVGLGRLEPLTWSFAKRFLTDFLAAAWFSAMGS